MINCAAYTNVDGAETHADLAHAVNGAGAGTSPRGDGAGAWTIHVSTDYVFDGRKREPVRRVRPGRAPVGLRALEARRRAGRGCRRRPARHTIVRSSWLFGAAGPCFPATILRLAGERDELSVVDDQVGCPTFTGHLAGALVALAGERRLAGHRPRGGRRPVLVVRVRAGDRRRGRRWRCEVQPGATADLGRPAPRPAYSVLGTERGGDSAAPAGLAGGAGGVHDVRRWRPDEAARLRRRRLHRLDVRAPARARARRRRDGARQAHLRRPAREPPRRDRRVRFVHGAIEDPDAVAAPRSAIARRSSTSPPRRTSIARSPGPRRSSSPTCRARTCCSRRRASAGLRYLQVSTDEVYGSIEEGSFTEESPLQPSSPYSATKTGADLLVASYFHTYGLETVICRGSNNYGPYQYPEKLIPLMILNALAGDQLPVYGDGKQRSQLAVRRGLRARDRPRAGARHARVRPTTAAARTSARTSRSCTRILELTGADESLIEYVTDRPGHDRRYSLSSEKLRRSDGSRACASTRGSSGRSTGIATTPGGGSRSAPARTASTTSGTTGAR